MAYLDSIGYVGFTSGKRFWGTYSPWSLTPEASLAGSLVFGLSPYQSYLMIDAAMPLLSVYFTLALAYSSG